MELTTQLRKKLIVFCFLGSIAAGINAQSDIVASGGDASGTGGSVSYSIGQIDFITKTGTGGMLTEGVQQPYEITIVTGNDEKRINLSAVVFPNPTSDYVKLRIENMDVMLHYALFNGNGRMIDKNRVINNPAKINMSSLNAGTYYFKVFSDEKILKIFKIIKLNY